MPPAGTFTSAVTPFRTYRGQPWLPVRTLNNRASILETLFYLYVVYSIVESTRLCQSFLADKIWLPIIQYYPG